MKNKRIVKAYDSINPSAADKARMLENILADAPSLQEPRRQSKAHREPVVYKKKPEKRSYRGILTGLAACFAVMIIGGFTLSRMAAQQDVNPAFVSPKENEAYHAVLSTYAKALEEGWSQEQCKAAGICDFITGINFSALDAGYSFMDLDDNGQMEMVITNGQGLVWDLYTLQEDGTPVNVYQEEDGWPVYRLYENGVVCAEDVAPRKIYKYYVYQDGAFAGPEVVLSQNGSNWVFEQADESAQTLTVEEAETKMAQYKLQQLDQTSLLSMISEEMAEKYRNPQVAHGDYMDVLAKYSLALAAGWDRTMCVENGMSMLTPIESANEGLYYAMFDLNGDGTEELIISEYPYRENTDTSFIDIYAIVDGTVRNVMSLGDTDMRSLCVHGYIKDISPSQQPEWDKYVSYWQFKAEQFEMEFAVGQRDGQWFTEGYRRVGAAITREEADEIVANYPPQKLDFQFIQSVPEKSDTGYAGFDHIIEKYVTALTENWTEEECQQNDISPQILDNTTITHNLGWCLVDIDNNGVEELVISDGVDLFDLYVMQPHNGDPGHLISANGGEAWSLRKNGVILQQGWYSGASAWRFYTLSDIDLIQRDMLFYEGATNQYSYGTDDRSLNPISKEKAGEIMARDENAGLDLTYFIPQTFDPDEVLHYQTLLERYQTALREDWSPAVCMENGLSLMVAHRGEYYEDLGYAMKDLDGNGIDELIITDGLNIYDLYTIIQDEEEGPLHLASAMERIQYYLTSDGWIYNLGSGGAAVSYHTLYSLEGRELKLLEGFMMDADTDPNNPWFYYDGENRLGPCPTAEAAAAMDSYVFAEIPFTPFQ